MRESTTLRKWESRFGSANSGSLSASRRGVEISPRSDRRVGERVPSAISMTLHPANVQDAHRTPVPDVSVGRARVEGDGRTYMYASIRSVQYVLALLSLHLPSPRRSARSFHVRSRCDARELSNPRLSQPLVPLLPPVLCPLPPCPRGKGTEYRRVHSRCTLTVTPPTAYTLSEAYTNGCGHIISTIDAIMVPQRQPRRCRRHPHLSNTWPDILAMPFPSLSPAIHPTDEISYSRRRASPEMHK